MNKRLLVLAGALVFSFATVSFAASPPPPETNRMEKPSSDFHGKKSAHTPKVQTTKGKTHPAGKNPVEKNNINDPSADFQGQKPGSPDPKVQTTSGKTHTPNTAGENNSMNDGK